MNPHQIDILGSVIFAVAILHTFCVKFFQRKAIQYPSGSIPENLFHWLGEIEVVFGFWAGILIMTLTFSEGQKYTVPFLEKLDYTEPLFVFVIMAMAATRPILKMAEKMMVLLARILPLPFTVSFLIVLMIVGPLMGSLITEPAAMTVSALLLKDKYFDKSVSTPFKYFALATLFVNISIGGVLTHFAAPPVLMVASKWGWTLDFMFFHFGWKAIIAVAVNTLLLVSFSFSMLIKMNQPATDNPHAPVPIWLTFVHIATLALVVKMSHHAAIFLWVFLFFVGIVDVTKEHQDDLKIKESMLVAFFLAGLVVLGQFQSWWLQPLLARLDPLALFVGATGLTAVVDNAALTYLGAQVSDISELLKYSLVAGAVAGGGLTVIANAPNPAGFSILRESFGNSGINPLLLFVYALAPTLVAMASLWFL